MSLPEHELARRIARYLNHGVDHIEPGVRERLIAARNTALSKYRERPQLVAGLAWAGAAARIVEHRHYGARYLFAVATIVLALVGIIAYWQSTWPVNELADIDTSLLTDELPINAYLDKGFDSWLKRSPR